jgi:hypothetical protein
MQRDAVEESAGVVTLLARREGWPEAGKLLRDFRGGAYRAVGYETWSERLARYHPLLAGELAGCVEPSQIIETVLHLIVGFDDELGRDWLPYSSD